MGKLLATTPHDELGARYPGKRIDTIGDAALPAPNSLIVIVGHTPGELAHVAGARLVTSISTIPPSGCNGEDCAVSVGINARGIDLVLSVVTAALLFPLLIFIATATRLSAARREQRFAAMRLVGATPRQVTVISTVESTVAAVIGVAGGFALFFLLRPLLAPIPFTGVPFFVGDLSLNLPDVLLVALGVPLGAAVAARLALRRVTISPLGVTRRVTPTPPSPWRVVPLLVGLGELGYFVATGCPASTGGQILAYLRSGDRRAMADHGRLTGTRATRPSPRGTDRRSPPVGQSADRLSGDQRAGTRAVRDHRRYRRDHDDQRLRRWCARHRCRRGNPGQRLLPI